MPPGLFITGTDTDVGKTMVAAAIALALRQAGRRVGVYKPAASGCPINPCGEAVSEDALILWEAAGRPGPLGQVCPQRFALPLAPHLAAREEGGSVDRELLRAGLNPWREASEIVIVEGVGGLLSPLADDLLVIELAQEFGYPLVIAAANRIGVLNQVLQTVHAARTFRGGLAIAGVVLNAPAPLDPRRDPSVLSNLTELRRLCPVPVLTELDFNAEQFEPKVDWWKLGIGS